VEDAQDLTQEFFSRFLERKYFRLADRERGRFRSFLLTALKHFLVNEWERANTQKRGGGKTVLPVDTVAAESLYSRELSHELSADRIYERAWATAKLTRVRDRLQRDYGAEGKAERFTRLEQFLPGQKGELTYAEAPFAADRRRGIRHAPESQPPGKGRRVKPRPCNIRQSTGHFF